MESTWLSRARSAALCSAKPRLEAAIGPSKSSLRVKVLQRHLAGLAGQRWCSIGFRVLGLGLGFRDSCASGRTRTRTRRGKTVPSPWASRHRASPSQLCRALAHSPGPFQRMEKQIQEARVGEELLGESPLQSAAGGVVRGLHQFRLLGDKLYQGVDGKVNQQVPDLPRFGILHPPSQDASHGLRKRGPVPPKP